MRFFSGSTIGYFAAEFFGLYSSYTDQFSILNALALLIGGIIANLATGYISDKYNAKHFMIKTHIQMFSSIMSIPPVLLCFLTTDNFYVSMAGLFLIYLLSEGWISPSIGMIQECADPSVKGVVIACFLLLCSLCGMLTNVLIGFLLEAGNSSPEHLGIIMIYCILIPNCISILTFYMAGRNYRAFRN